jgi:2-polyprenyl-6-hydroxyphenyl methylase/3-demethylubiquinone-9 3-methyltransferase
LKAEIDFVLSYINPGDIVLELGCGYGRVLRELDLRTGFLIGIDTSLDSIYSAKSYLVAHPYVMLACMDAAHPSFKSNTYDLTICIQNGISAFHIPPEILISESIRITKPGGHVLISSYTSDIWQDRLEWFRLQSEAGLIGEIDWDKTGNGKIVSKDGFSGNTYSQYDFDMILEPFKISYEIIRVDNSSIFCDIRIPQNN